MTIEYLHTIINRSKWGLLALYWSWIWCCLTDEQDWSMYWLSLINLTPSCSDTSQVASVFGLRNEQKNNRLYSLGDKSWYQPMSLSVGIFLGWVSAWQEGVSYRTEENTVTIIEYPTSSLPTRPRLSSILIREDFKGGYWSKIHLPGSIKIVLLDWIQNWLLRQAISRLFQSEIGSNTTTLSGFSKKRCQHFTAQEVADLLAARHAD